MGSCIDCIYWTMTRPHHGYGEAYHRCASVETDTVGRRKYAELYLFDYDAVALEHGLAVELKTGPDFGCANFQAISENENHKMIKTNKTTKLTETLTLIERTDGFWLFDEPRGMNLSMRAKTAQSALVEALSYYQSHLAMVEQTYSVMKTKIDAFVAQFIDEENYQ